MSEHLRSALLAVAAVTATLVLCWLMLAAVVGLFWYPVVIVARILEAM